MTNLLSPEEAQRYGVAPPDVPAPVEAAPSASPPPVPYPPACMAGWQRVTEDAAVCRGPAIFYGAVLTSDGVGTADVILYDGLNTGGRRLFQLRAPTTQTVPLIIPDGVPLEDGLYVDVGSNVGDLFLIYSPLRG